MIDGTKFVVMVPTLSKALSVIAIGPKGGKIVGYKQPGNKPIYQGSKDAIILAKKEGKEQSKKTTVETIVEWIKSLFGFSFKPNKDGTHTMVFKSGGKMSAEALEAHFNAALSMVDSKSIKKMSSIKEIKKGKAYMYAMKVKFSDDPEMNVPKASAEDMGQLPAYVQSYASWYQLDPYVEDYPGMNGSPVIPGQTAIFHHKDGTDFALSVHIDGVSEKPKWTVVVPAGGKYWEVPDGQYKPVHAASQCSLKVADKPIHMTFSSLDAAKALITGYQEDGDKLWSLGDQIMYMMDDLPEPASVNPNEPVTDGSIDALAGADEDTAPVQVIMDTSGENGTAIDLPSKAGIEEHLEMPLYGGEKQDINSSLIWDELAEAGNLNEVEGINSWIGYDEGDVGHGVWPKDLTGYNSGSMVFAPLMPAGLAEKMAATEEEVMKDLLVGKKIQIHGKSSSTGTMSPQTFLQSTIPLEWSFGPQSVFGTPASSLFSMPKLVTQPSGNKLLTNAFYIVTGSVATEIDPGEHYKISSPPTPSTSSEKTVKWESMPGMAKHILDIVKESIGPDPINAKVKPPKAGAVTAGIPDDELHFGGEPPSIRIKRNAAPKWNTWSVTVKKKDGTVQSTDFKDHISLAKHISDILNSSEVEELESSPYIDAPGETELVAASVSEETIKHVSPVYEASPALHPFPVSNAVDAPSNWPEWASDSHIQPGSVAKYVDANGSQWAIEFDVADDFMGDPASPISVNLHNLSSEDHEDHFALTPEAAAQILLMPEGSIQTPEGMTDSEWMGYIAKATELFYSGLPLVVDETGKTHLDTIPKAAEIPVTMDYEGMHPDDLAKVQANSPTGDDNFVTMPESEVEAVLSPMYMKGATPHHVAQAIASAPFKWKVQHGDKTGVHQLSKWAVNGKFVKPTFAGCPSPNTWKELADDASFGLHLFEDGGIVVEYEGKKWQFEPALLKKDKSLGPELAKKLGFGDPSFEYGTFDTDEELKVETAEEPFHKTQFDAFMDVLKSPPGAGGVKWKITYPVLGEDLTTAVDFIETKPKQIINWAKKGVSAPPGASLLGGPSGWDSSEFDVDVQDDGSVVVSKNGGPPFTFKPHGSKAEVASVSEKLKNSKKAEANISSWEEGDVSPAPAQEVVAEEPVDTPAETPDPVLIEPDEPTDLDMVEPEPEPKKKTQHMAAIIDEITDAHENEHLIIDGVKASDGTITMFATGLTFSNKDGIKGSSQKEGGKSNWKWKPKPAGMWKIEGLSEDEAHDVLVKIKGAMDDPDTLAFTSLLASELDGKIDKTFADDIAEKVDAIPEDSYVPHSQHEAIVETMKGWGGKWKISVSDDEGKWSHEAKSASKINSWASKGTNKPSFVKKMEQEPGEDLAFLTPELPPPSEWDSDSVDVSVDEGEVSVSMGGATWKFSPSGWASTKANVAQMLNGFIPTTSSKTKKGDNPIQKSISEQEEPIKILVQPPTKPSPGNKIQVSLEEGFEKFGWNVYDKNTSHEVPQEIPIKQKDPETGKWVKTAEMKSIDVVLAEVPSNGSIVAGELMLLSAGVNVKHPDFAPVYKPYGGNKYYMVVPKDKFENAKPTLYEDASLSDSNFETMPEGVLGAAAYMGANYHGLVTLVAGKTSNITGVKAGDKVHVVVGKNEVSIHAEDGSLIEGYPTPVGKFDDAMGSKPQLIRQIFKKYIGFDTLDNTPWEDHVQVHHVGSLKVSEIPDIVKDVVANTQVKQTQKLIDSGDLNYYSAATAGAIYSVPLANDPWEAFVVTGADGGPAAAYDNGGNQIASSASEVYGLSGVWKDMLDIQKASGGKVYKHTYKKPKTTAPEGVVTTGAYASTMSFGQATERVDVPLSEVKMKGVKGFIMAAPGTLYGQARVHTIDHAYGKRTHKVSAFLGRNLHGCLLTAALEKGGSAAYTCDSSGDTNFTFSAESESFVPITSSQQHPLTSATSGGAILERKNVTGTVEVNGKEVKYCIWSHAHDTEVSFTYPDDIGMSSRDAYKESILALVKGTSADDHVTGAAADPLDPDVDVDLLHKWAVLRKRVPLAQSGWDNIPLAGLDCKTSLHDLIHQIPVNAGKGHSQLGEFERASQSNFANDILSSDKAVKSVEELEKLYSESPKVSDSDRASTLKIKCTEERMSYMLDYGKKPLGDHPFLKTGIGTRSTVKGAADLIQNVLDMGLIGRKFRISQAGSPYKGGGQSAQEDLDYGNDDVFLRPAGGSESSSGITSLYGGSITVLVNPDILGDAHLRSTGNDAYGKISSSTAQAHSSSVEEHLQSKQGELLVPQVDTSLMCGIGVPSSMRLGVISELKERGMIDVAGIPIEDFIFSSVGITGNQPSFVKAKQKKAIGKSIVKTNSKKVSL